MVVPFIEIGNPGGKAGLGDRGRKEFNVSHDESEAGRISYLMEVLQLTTAVPFSGKIPKWSTRLRKTWTLNIVLDLSHTVLCHA